MANIMALTVARDVHLAKLRGDLPRGARVGRRAGVRVRPDPLLRRAGRRPPRFPGGDAPDRGLGRRLPLAGRTGRRRDRGGSRGGPHAVRDLRRGRLDEHRLDRRRPGARRPRRTRRTLAARRRRVRRGRPAVIAGGAQAPRPRTSRLPHRRSAQVAVPALRHRRAARAAARGSAAHVPPRARVLRRVGSRGAAAPLVPVLARGDPAVPCAQALALVEAPRLGRLRPA